MGPKYPDVTVQLTGEDGNAWCPGCERTLPLSRFSPRKDVPAGHRTKCKDCEAKGQRARYASDPEGKAETARRGRKERPEHHRLVNRRYRFKKVYGITVEEYEAMLTAQNGRCAICKTEEPSGPGARFAVDHDHATGAVRGLLCSKCNTALGLLSDRTDLLRTAIEYLEEANRGSQIS